ncbi:SH3 and multiple ankyrin repeat domains protein 2 [Orbilia blumenaviensis]|uniref:SH3 and multiple ankyrin repeat domains protein 2 n=1 Tax=Orbilia blumenaviensis TaxID=1796055 RepID=A0AAV9VJ35_9PEZI
MDNRKKRLKYEDYSVGLIYVKPLEMNAIIPMLDEEHESLPLPEQDQNEYTLGKIGSHNVLIVGPPIGQQGKVAIANVVGRIPYTFKNVKMGLLVGIGGGVPRPNHDVRLGDVVVGAPEYGPAVVQYDLGKMTAEGTIEVTRSLNKPPAQLLNVVTKLKSQYLRLAKGGESFFARHLKRYENFPNLKNTYSRPSLPDHLFVSTYIHEATTDCNHHNNQYLIQRGERQEEIQIHYSTILSGDLVMKSGETRDKISAQHHNALCFEMEAAGLMDSLSCLVIRGICDYSDSHKNKEWQGYAAATAAAYAREVLCVMAERTLGDLAALRVSDTSEKKIEVGLTERQDSDRIKFLKMLSFPEMNNRERTVESAYVQTFEWLRNSDAYKNWLMTRGEKLLIKGKAGCGKSTLMKYLYEKEKSSQKYPIVCGFFFNNRGAPIERTTIAMLRTIIHQMVFQHPTLFSKLQCFYDDMEAVSEAQNRQADWTKAQLEKIFTIIVSSPNVNGLIYIDALDEGEGFIPSEIFKFLEEQLTSGLNEPTCDLRICLSSRPDNFINRRTTWTTIDLGNENSEDIKLYVTEKLRKTAKACKSFEETFSDDDEEMLDDEDQTYSDDEEILVDGDQTYSGYDEIVPELSDEILRKADGVFLWAKLVVERLQKAMNDYEDNDVIWSILEESPKDLYALFISCLEKVDQRNRNKMKEILQIVLAAERPLSIDELADLMKTVPESQQDRGVACARVSKKNELLSTGDQNPAKGRSRSPEVKRANAERQDMRNKIQNWCGGLVEVITTFRQIYLTVPYSRHRFGSKFEHLLSTEVRFMHQSVKDFLREQTGWNNTLLNGIEATSHELLFSRCIRYLKELENSSFYHRRVAYPRLLWSLGTPDWHSITQKHPFLIYTPYWIKHAENYTKKDPNMSKTELQHVYKLFEDWRAYPYEDDPNICEYGLYGSIYKNIRPGEYPHAFSSLLVMSAYQCFDNLAESLLLNSNLKFEQDDLDKALISACDCGLAFSNSDSIITISLKSVANRQSLKPGSEERGLTRSEEDWLAMEKIMDLLIRNGANVSVKGGNERSKFRTPLTVACWGGRLSMVERLLAEGADVNELVHEAVYSTPLIAAGWGGSIPVAKFLIRKGAQVNLLAGQVKSALAEAVLCRSIDMVKLLLDEGAIIDQLLESKRCGSALTAAAGIGDENMVKLLVSRGASVNLEGSTGPPLLAAISCVRESGMAIMEYLVQNGANINAVLERAYYGCALIAACFTPTMSPLNNISERITFLVEHGADVNLEIKRGEYGSALAAFAAVEAIFGEEKSVAGMQYLIEKGARVNERLSSGIYGCALISAAVHGGLKSMKFLIENGADVNLVARTGTYRSALEVVTGRYKLEVYWESHSDRGSQNRISAIKLLLDNGADVDEVLRAGQFRPEYLNIILPYAKDPALKAQFQNYREDLVFRRENSEDEETDESLEDDMYVWDLYA